ncbi:hypothetical protein [Paenibacillus xylanexedens]|uniref:hypothetical protein n=1 Tax=Paenibacillus xylanexedens TaxID=528191 RepID=UPI00119CED32|nr:hypothetical protein [Paenibacillus xylanexedens]
MDNRVKELVQELDNLHSDYDWEYDKALNLKNKYHEQQERYEKIGEKIREKLREIQKVDPHYEYETEFI